MIDEKSKNTIIAFAVCVLIIAVESFFLFSGQITVRRLRKQNKLAQNTNKQLEDSIKRSRDEANRIKRDFESYRDEVVRADRELKESIESSLRTAGTIEETIAAIELIIDRIAERFDSL